ncbi:Clp protease N-terminal domain-containing protein, partial [Streptomyces sp. NPDC056983]
ARHDRHIGVEHLGLSLVTMTSGLVPSVLAALGASAPALRTAITDRYRQAS